jgi:hypothetical protein
VTGFSFGVVAGISSSLKLLKRSTRQCYIMPEVNWESSTFAQKGDSGSAVISRGIGFVMARIVMEDFEVAVDPITKYLDLQAMKAYRDHDDGSISFEKVWFETGSRVQGTLVMDNKVLEARCGIKEWGELIIDT